MARFFLLLICLPLLAAGPAKPRKSYLRIPVVAESKAAPGSADALQSSGFVAKLDGSPARVLASRGPGDGLILLLVMDVTESMSLVDIAKDALVTAVEGLPPTTHVGVLRAQDGLSVLVDPTTDRTRVADAIRNVSVSGKAGLLESVETASRLVDSMLSKAHVRVALLYVTDSSIYNYRDDYTNPVINWSDQHDMSRRFPEGLITAQISRLQSRLAAFDGPLFIIHLDYRSDRLNEAYQTGLMQLASESGGASAFCRSRMEIPDAIANTFGMISSHYLLDLQMPEQVEKVVQVQLENNGHALTYRNRVFVNEK